MSNKSCAFAPEMKMKKAKYQTPLSHIIGELPVMCMTDLSSTVDPNASSSAPKHSV